MIELKEAVRKAKDYVFNVYEGLALLDIRLEEIRRSDDGKFWLVTVSFKYPVDSMDWSKIQHELQWNMSATEVVEAVLKGLRDYKVVKVDTQSGEVLSMTNRAA